MNQQSVRLHFPAEVNAESVAAILRVAAAEPRGSVFGPPPEPMVFETRLSHQVVGWWLRVPDRRLGYLRAAMERELPGLRLEQGTPPELPNISRAVELRVNSPERLLAVDLAEPASQRLLGVAHELRPDEVVAVQWLVGAWLVRSPIPPTSTAARSPGLWTSFDVRPNRDSEQVSAVRTKQQEHIFAAVGRVAVAGSGAGTHVPRGRAERLLASTIGAYQLLRAPGVGISRRWLPSWWVSWQFGKARVSQLGPAIRLTGSELAGVIGWPLGTPDLPGVHYQSAIVRPLDRRVLTTHRNAGEWALGEASYPSQTGQVAVLPPAEGLRHLHVLGPTGVGKSTLAARGILASIHAGRGVVAIDPKGDLVSDVVERVSERLRDRVVLLDPSDPSPVGFNPLASARGSSADGVAIDGVLSVFRSLWSGSWGPRLGDILHAGLLTLAMNEGRGLPELPLLLSDASFRRPLVARAVARDPLGLGTFWTWFEALSDENRAQALAPVMNKLRAFLLRPELRAVLGQAEPRFDLNQVFTHGRCLLVRLPKGQLGSEGAQLLGSLLVSHLWRLAQRRIELPAARRAPTFVYLDEFQEFLRLPLDLSDAMVQARGLGVGLVLAHQHLDQADRSVRSAVLANAGSRVVFRLDHDDAAVIAKRSGGQLRAEDLSGLGAYEAYASLLTGAEATPYGSLRTLPLGPATGEGAGFLEHNRRAFGVPASETEERLRRLIGDGGGLRPTPETGAIGGRPVDGGGSAPATEVGQ